MTNQHKGQPCVRSRQVCVGKRGFLAMASTRRTRPRPYGGVYANPNYDFTFDHLFKDPIIMKGFLELLGIQATEVKYLYEHDQGLAGHPFGRGVLFDLSVTLPDSTEVRVILHHLYKESFADRLLFYSARALAQSHERKLGAPYSMTKCYTIAITDYESFQADDGPAPWLLASGGCSLFDQSDCFRDTDRSRSSIWQCSEPIGSSKLALPLR